MLSIDRAKSIMESNSNLEVIYNNVPVWLEDINDKRSLVQIRNLRDNNCMVVPACDLTETGRIL
ncbi:small, acid-soluble spore protein, H family [Clostridium aestuarii]|uniref:Small, acid-soluble spore protein, H family n=1 Tax=Clostridium aestuarii TaxID=338193 RepID=A0ABT4D0X5_9CLOT|nr:small, acid-soluble spore protein, H family [Clostridium aestuarii]MCY6484884.1 small, acid-soluble spore protein, H family [Clostridium aestuarii]